MTRAAEPLRGERLAASVITVFIETSRFVPEEERHANLATHELLYSTDAGESKKRLRSTDKELTFRRKRLKNSRKL